MSRTACKNGHEYTDGSWVQRGTIKVCLECARDRRSAPKTGLKPGRRRKRSKPETVDPGVLAAAITAVRVDGTSIAQAARDAGCTKDYLYRAVWRDVKLDVLTRDKGCLVCGTVAGTIDVQHRIARGMGGSGNTKVVFGLAHLISLCRAHHTFVEAHPDWARERGYRVNRGSNPEEVPVLAYGRTWVRFASDGTVVVELPETGT